ncbi:hypothetical protein SGUI_1614 [Serinicoccus hydrothermalis]|uniref:DUF4260 family protein n=1 Tax=Serinicoccus hydrothermalis TaxID=1758689 RepID=A0A1B1NC27_9MICO|nr:DUF4260 family protein [Serinicoccus hydrothermalis]ANS79010.1 hypothetical protein SGUI_1614 [Serinicoccus hydrothermalis]
MTFPVWFQRIESATVAVLAVVAFVQLGFAWWWLLVVFLVWDVSMLGYLASPRLGGITYNVGHSYVGPAALLVLAWVVPGDARWPLFVAVTWAFHIAVDRLLGTDSSSRTASPTPTSARSGRSPEPVIKPAGAAQIVSNTMVA